MENNEERGMHYGQHESCFVCWFVNLKFNLFGEFKIFYWIFGIIVLLIVIFWGVAGSVIFHFIAKYW